MINIKRIKDEPREDDGYRILVDRLWPVGMTKEKAKLGIWLKDLGPSNGLRKWFSFDAEKWDEFKKRYFDELKDKDELINTVIDKSKEGTVTLLFGSKETKYNNAVALKEYIDAKIGGVEEENANEKLEKVEEENANEKLEKVEEEKVEEEKVEEEENANEKLEKVEEENANEKLEKVEEEKVEEEKVEEEENEDDR